jgi:hypothetical protein
LDGFARGDGQHNAGTLDLEEGQMAAVCYGSQKGSIRSSDRHGVGLSATHGETSDAGASAYYHPTPCHEFVAELLSRGTRVLGS